MEAEGVETGRVNNVFKNSWKTQGLGKVLDIFVYGEGREIGF